MGKKVIGAMVTFGVVFAGILIYITASAGVALVFASIVRKYTKAFWTVIVSIAAAGALFIACLNCSGGSNDSKPEENSKNI